LGLTLDAKAFAAAWAGAQHLRAEVAKVQAYLTMTDPADLSLTRGRCIALRSRNPHLPRADRVPCWPGSPPATPAWHAFTHIAADALAQADRADAMLQGG
jgi:hypothetical protein